MSKIKEIKARQIFDSRGNPTVEADVITSNGIKGTAAVPSGASTGKYEAVELRDNNKEKYLGKSVFNAVSNINKLISKKLIGYSVFDQNIIDQLMIDLDGTENKSKIGANAILAVSLAVSKAAASEKGISLPSSDKIGISGLISINPSVIIVFAFISAAVMGELSSLI